jgi:hypothetical protein
MSFSNNNPVSRALQTVSADVRFYYPVGIMEMSKRRGPMTELDDILKAHKAKIEEDEREREKAAENERSKADFAMTVFKDCIDNTVLPILDEYKRTLARQGYMAEIIKRPATDPRQARKEFYAEVAFKLNTELTKSLKTTIRSERERSIIFQPADRPNVTLIFGHKSRPVECSEFFVRQELLEIFKKVFPS